MVFALGGPTPYNVPGMNESRVDVAQLQKRDPQAWTALLAGYDGLEDVVVTAVTAVPLHQEGASNGYSRRVVRYLVSLANTSDPIPFIAKKTGPEEAFFYRDLAATIPDVAPRCWFTHVVGEDGWVILDDVPNHVAIERWSPVDVDNVINDMVMFHVTYWDQPDLSIHYPWLPHFVGRRQQTYTWEQLRREHAVYFEEGPAALISDHALQHLGHLAPLFLEAANGLAVMRALGGWPGVIGESHLAAAADLLDDPLPMLEPLLRLPPTLLHGDMNKRHWHLTLFQEQRLLDWRKVVSGPAICDLISFQEQFDLLFTKDGIPAIHVDGTSVATEETIIDSYILAMKAELGSQFDARQMRQALPAARCLQILTTCFPHFATWFNRMPDKYTWQRVNRMPDADLTGRALLPIVGYRPYLRDVFRRFLQAYRML
jgi:hypothetical protein